MSNSRQLPPSQFPSEIDNEEQLPIISEESDPVKASEYFNNLRSAVINIQMEIGANMLEIS